MVIQKLHLSNCLEGMKCRLDILMMLFAHTTDNLDDDHTRCCVRLHGLGLWSPGCGRRSPDNQPPGQCKKEHRSPNDTPFKTNHVKGPGRRRPGGTPAPRISPSEEAARPGHQYINNRQWCVREAEIKSGSARGIRTIQACIPVMEPHGCIHPQASLAVRARLARKTGLVGSFICASGACLACLTQASRTTRTAFGGFLRRWVNPGRKSAGHGRTVLT